MGWWIAGATVAGSVIGASGQKSAAKTAASSQTQAAELQAEVQREVLAAQREVYDEQVARLDPFRKTGVAGSCRIWWVYPRPVVRLSIWKIIMLAHSLPLSHRQHSNSNWQPQRLPVAYSQPAPRTSWRESAPR